MASVTVNLVTAPRKLEIFRESNIICELLGGMGYAVTAQLNFVFLFFLFVTKGSLYRRQKVDFLEKFQITKCWTSLYYSLHPIARDVWQHRTGSLRLPQ